MTRHQILAGLPVANHEPLHLGAVPRDEIPDEREVSETPADYNRIREPVNEGVWPSTLAATTAPATDRSVPRILRDAVPASSLTPPFSSSAVAIVEPQTSTAHHIES